MDSREGNWDTDNDDIYLLAAVIHASRYGEDRAHFLRALVRRDHLPGRREPVLVVERKLLAGDIPGLHAVDGSRATQRAGAEARAELRLRGGDLAGLPVAVAADMNTKVTDFVDQWNLIQDPSQTTRPAIGQRQRAHAVRDDDRRAVAGNAL